MSTDMFDRSRSRTRREYQPSEENVSYVGSDRNETAYEGINVEGNNESMLVVSSTNPTAIFSAIKERDWSTVVNLCLNAPENHAGTWIVEKNVDRSIRWKLLPIHQACESKAPSEAVKALIEAYPDGVSMKDSGGDLPLHLACRAKSSRAVIAALLSKDHNAARSVDDEGRIPLHLACRQGCGVEIIDDLIIAYHNGALVFDSYNLLPLHWACAQNASVTVVESLLRAYPEGVDEEDKWGRTPKSLVTASTNKHKVEILEALKRDPSYWTTTLIDEISDLKYELGSKTHTEKRSTARASNLETKLAEVTIASSSAAQTFRSLKNELESENEELRIKMRNTTALYNENEQVRQQLEGDNSRLKRDIKSLTSRLNSAGDIFRGMEEQRMNLVKVTGNMESNLEKASAIAKENY